jgi:hypothetical protein
MPARKPATEGGSRKRAQCPTTAAAMSRELRVMAMTSLGFVGGVKYLERVAKTNPAAYLAFLAKVVAVKNDGAEIDGSRTYVVRTLNVIAQPTPGVINSPVAGHIAAPRLVANGGEVIDAEPSAPHG